MQLTDPENYIKDKAKTTSSSGERHKDFTFKRFSLQIHN